MRFFKLSSLFVLFAFCGLAQSPGGLFGVGGSARRHSLSSRRNRAASLRFRFLVAFT